ncbi:MAG: ROK family protein [Eubacterium sp.]|nr:ROK family protein [Eubacterium sp.]
MRIGIDIGGTNLVAAAVDDQGRIIQRVSCPTQAQGGYSLVRDQIFSLTADLIAAQGQPVFIGAGVPGIISADGSRVVNAPNIGWIDKPFKAELEAHFGVPVGLGNDATVAGIAENRFGSTRGYKDAVMLTLGTGVGGSVIAGGRVITGAHGTGSEFGHIVLDEQGPRCNCGKRGCLETYASSTAIIRQAKEFLAQGRGSTILEAAGGRAEVIDAKMILDAAAAGDAVGQDCFKTMTQALGRAIAMISDVIDPKIYTLGGGVSRAGEFLRAAVAEEALSRITFREAGVPKIVLAELGNDAGLVGAAFIDLY